VFQEKFSTMHVTEVEVAIVVISHPPHWREKNTFIV
jgi:hypothetical protein